MKKYWDHSTKPSTYVVSLNEEELFRGTYVNGIMYIKSLKNDGMISFKDDYLPAMCNTIKRACRALSAVKELRIEVLKLKKELKKQND
tara:strand:+ start:501 stop:764 length:264 start_codon:yes stop_codon:yes gene_type:complete